MTHKNLLHKIISWVAEKFMSRDHIFYLIEELQIISLSKRIS
jgi:hypothetical protein